MYARNYTDWQKNEVSEFYSLNDNFTIKNKANGQFVIINMLGGNADTSFYRFNVNGKGTGGLTDVDISDTVILNAVNVKGNIQIGELCGIVIAPYADVKLYNTCNGRVIAKTFENVSGQLHFVSDEQEEGTTSRETVSETSKSAESESTEITKSSENASTEAVKPTEKESKATGGMSETKTGEKETNPSHTISGSDYSGNNVTTGQVAADEEQVTRATKKGQVAADEDYVADGSNIKKTSDNSAMDSDSTVKNGKKAEVGADEDLVQTGDNKHIGIYIGILVAAVIVSGIVIAVNRKKSDK